MKAETLIEILQEQPKSEVLVRWVDYDGDENIRVLNADSVYYDDDSHFVVDISDYT